MTAPVMPMQSSASSLAPRKFAGQRAQRPAQPTQGTATDTSLQQPATTSPTQQTDRPPAPQQSGANTGPVPQTFAQMQAAGVARPAPPQISPSVAPVQTATGSVGGVQIPTTTSASVAAPPAGDVGAVGGGNQTGSSPVATTPYPTTNPTTQPTTTTPTSAVPGVGASLQDAVQAALSNAGTRYGPAFDAQKDALTQQLQQTFGSQQKQLDEEMARRGVGASSIAAGYNGDLQGQQDMALATMNADLLKDEAANHAADQTSALSAGQNLLNSQNQSGQFSQQLAQALGISQMSDKTANRGIDANAALANNDLMLKIAALLGLPSSSLSALTTGTTGATNPQNPTTSTPAPSSPVGGGSPVSPGGSTGVAPGSSDPGPASFGASGLGSALNAILGGSSGSVDPYTQANYPTQLPGMSGNTSLTTGIGADTHYIDDAGNLNPAAEAAANAWWRTHFSNGTLRPGVS